jgi:hypothetical protein
MYIRNIYSKCAVNDMKGQLLWSVKVINSSPTNLLFLLPNSNKVVWGSFADRSVR